MFRISPFNTQHPIHPSQDDARKRADLSFTINKKIYVSKNNQPVSNNETTKILCGKQAMMEGFYLFAVSCSLLECKYVF